MFLFKLLISIKRTAIIIVLFSSSLISIAQPREYKGHVYVINEKGEKTPIYGATLFFVDELRNGTRTEANGKFTIKRNSDKDSYLKASFIGYVSDSILITKNYSSPIDFVLTESIHILEEANINIARKGTLLSKFTPQKTELISTTGLMKMACCNLSESFENSATITVGYTDAISGAKQVQLLGLSGMYSQMMNENVPTLRGLASTYGWSYTPGSWLESIQISKGASSVVNGYESISGQINVEHKKPNTSDPLFVNLFYDSEGMMEGNLIASTKVASKLWTSLLLNGSLAQKAHDENGDCFMDMPQSNLYNVYNRWFYLDSERGIQSRFGVRFLMENRHGGQVLHDHKDSKVDLSNPYETNIDNKNFSIYNKTGISIGDDQRHSIGFISSYTIHDQRSKFGLKMFNGIQKSFYSNLLFTSDLGSPSHKYTLGASFIYDDYDMEYEDKLPFNDAPLTRMDKKEVTPGAFAEYTYLLNESLTLVLGSRIDHNSRFGWLFTPRANLKYSFEDYFDFRLSAGKGFRSSNLIAENIGLMASSRKFHIDNVNNLDIEKAWNFGINLTTYIPIWDDRKATLSVDFFSTEFLNQNVVDTERDRLSVYFYDLKGRSYANVLQADLLATLFDGFDLFAAFRYNTTKISYVDGDKTILKEKPLNSRYRGLLNLAYATKFRRWVFDATMQVNGPSRLPGMNGYSSQERESEVFPIYFAQITKNSKRFDFYVGVENLLNYKQKNPIIDSSAPFGENFDSSIIWGPLMGRKIYLGMRLRLGKLK